MIRFDFLPGSAPQYVDGIKNHLLQRGCIATLSHSGALHDASHQLEITTDAPTALLFSLDPLKKCYGYDRNRPPGVINFQELQQA